jgi:hypothetical protein
LENKMAVENTKTMARVPVGMVIPTKVTLIIAPTDYELRGQEFDPWQAGEPVGQGDIRRASNGRLYWALEDGSSGSAEPTQDDGDSGNGTTLWRAVSRGRNVLTISNLGPSPVYISRGFNAVVGAGLFLSAGTSLNEGYESGPRPYSGAWYAIADGSDSAIAISEG